MPTIHIKETRGWTSESRYFNRTLRSVFTTPEGEQYVWASPRETPDLIVKGGIQNMGLRLLSTSTYSRSESKAARDIQKRGRARRVSK